MSEDRFPARIHKTGFGWDESRSSYKVQVGNHECTLAYAWVPVGGRDDVDVIDEAVEIANRICDAWNARSAQA